MESLSVMVHDRKITSPLAFELIEFLTPEFLETPPPPNPASGLILNYCLLQLHPFLGTETL